MFCTVQLDFINFSGSGLSDTDMYVECVLACLQSLKLYGDGKVVKINLVL